MGTVKNMKAIATESDRPLDARLLPGSRGRVNPVQSPPQRPSALSSTAAGSAPKRAKKCVIARAPEEELDHRKMDREESSGSEEDLSHLNQSLLPKLKRRVAKKAAPSVPNATSSAPRPSAKEAMEEEEEEEEKEEEEDLSHLNPRLLPGRSHHQAGSKLLPVAARAAEPNQAAVSPNAAAARKRSKGLVNIAAEDDAEALRSKRLIATKPEDGRKPAKRLRDSYEQLAPAPAAAAAAASSDAASSSTTGRGRTRKQHAPPALSVEEEAALWVGVRRELIDLHDLLASKKRLVEAERLLTFEKLLSGIRAANSCSSKPDPTLEDGLRAVFTGADGKATSKAAMRTLLPEFHEKVFYRSMPGTVFHYKVLVNIRVQIGALIAIAGQGALYDAVCSDGGRERLVVCKLSFRETRKRLLLEESRVYVAIRDNAGADASYFPEYILYAEEPEYAALVMERLGPNLMAEFHRRKCTMSPIGVVTVARLMLDALSKLHNLMIVHRDVSLTNILLPLEGTSRQPPLALVDFGTAQSLRGYRIPDDSFIGTRTFGSVAAHELSSQTWADDLESLGFCLWYLLKGGNLPWSDVSGSSFEEFLKQIHAAKKAALKDLARASAPMAVQEYFRVLHTLRKSATQPVSYDAVKLAFAKALQPRLSTVAQVDRLAAVLE
jgi:hypothetical protein